MRILLVGAGKAGWQLAEQLCKEKHDVVVVDQDAKSLADIEGRFDVLTVKGHGACPAVLREADLSKSDLLVSMTNMDEINILACLIAKQAGVKSTVARISSETLRDDPGFRLEDAGVDLVVSKTTAIASELGNILLLPGTQEVIDVFEGRIQVVGFKVSMDSPLARSPLQTAAEPELLSHLRLIAVIRGTELIIPRGDTQLMIGDEVYVASTPEHIKALLSWCLPEHTPFAKIIVAGGGMLGVTLAHNMESSAANIVLIEQDRSIATACSTALNKTLVIHGDALSEEVLQEVGLIPGTAFVASTGSDENNMILCLMAERLGANFTVAQINNPEYLTIINSQSLLDRAVSSYVAMSNSVLHFMRGKHLKSASVLHQLPGDLLEVDLQPGHRWAGQTIQEIKFPKGTLVAAVDRDQTAYIPTGPFTLLPGDRLLVFAQTSSVNKVIALFKQ